MPCKEGLDVVVVVSPQTGEENFLGTQRTDHFGGFVKSVSKLNCLNCVFPVFWFSLHSRFRLCQVYFFTDLQWPDYKQVRYNTVSAYVSHRHE